MVCAFFKIHDFIANLMKNWNCISNCKIFTSWDVKAVTLSFIIENFSTDKPLKIHTFGELKSVRFIEAF